MKVFIHSIIFICGLATCGWADVAKSSQTVYDKNRVETVERLIVLHPVDDDVRFSITLRDKVSGAEKRYEFDGEGASDPSPFLLDTGQYCGASVVLLTIKYPWRHALPQYARVLETFAFRAGDLAFIDRALGPLTDIALREDGQIERDEAGMHHPIGVRCLADPKESLFRFIATGAD